MFGIFFQPTDDLEKSLYEAIRILRAQHDGTGDQKFYTESLEVERALINYHRRHECAGGSGHEWNFCPSCHPDHCGAPNGDCQNLHTVWCPTCLGCEE